MGGCYGFGEQDVVECQLGCKGIMGRYVFLFLDVFGLLGVKRKGVVKVVFVFQYSCLCFFCELVMRNYVIGLLLDFSLEVVVGVVGFVVVDVCQVVCVVGGIGCGVLFGGGDVEVQFRMVLVVWIG